MRTWRQSCGVYGKGARTMRGFPLILLLITVTRIASSSGARSVVVRVCRNLATTPSVILWPNIWSIKKVSLPVISRLLRRKSLQTTERYLQAIDPVSGYHEALGGRSNGTYSPKKQEVKFFDLPSPQTVGGSAWESNPPTAFLRRYTGFEVRGPHQ